MPATVNDVVSNVVKKDCASGVCSVSDSAHSRTDIVAETPVLTVEGSFAEYAHDRKVWGNVNRGAKYSTNSGTNDVKGEDYGASHTSSELFASNEQTEEISETQCQMSRKKNRLRMPDMSSALARDMVDLYRNKVLPKANSCTLVSSGCGTHSATPASEASSGINSCKISDTAMGMQVPNSSMRHLERTVAAKTTYVSKSPFKLVTAMTFQPCVCHGETVLSPISKLSQATAHFDRGILDSAGERTRSSALTSCHFDGVPYSSSASNNRVVSCLSSMPKNISVQVTRAVSSNSNAVSNSNNCAAVSSVTNFAHGKNATPNARTLVSSKYKLIRRRESACKNTSRQITVKDSDVNSCVPHRVVKHTPTLLVVNKYKLVRKKRRSLTMSVKRTPSDIKETVTSTHLGPVVLPTFCRSSSASASKTRSSRYKLVRGSRQPQSTPVKKSIKQSAPSRPGPVCGNSLASNSKMRSGRYKLVRESDQPYSTPVKKLIKQSVSNEAGRFGGNSTASSSKMRLSRYKLVRAGDQQHATSVKKLGTGSVLNQAGDKVQVLSKYKLIRRKCPTTLRTPKRATSTPANCSQNVSDYTRRLYNKHTTPPLFLNKYKLIRKRVLLRTNSSCVKNSTLRSSHCFKHISKPSAEGFKHLYSRKQHTAAGTSSLHRLLPGKRRRRNRSFTSQYALQRSGRG